MVRLRAVHGGNTPEWERTHMRNVKGLPNVRQHVQKSVITNTLTGKEGKGDRFQRPSPGELQETVEDKMQANTVVPHLKQLSSDPGIRHPSFLDEKQDTRGGMHSALSRHPPRRETGPCVCN